MKKAIKAGVSLIALSLAGAALAQGVPNTSTFTQTGTGEAATVTQGGTGHNATVSQN